MRTAIISDIHGNYPALMKVLEDAHTEDVDNFIFLGDYYMDFPFANEVVAELMSMENAYIIKGNKENAMKRLREESPDDYSALHYIVREFTQESYDYLNGLEDEMYIRLSPAALVYATHISPIFGKSQGATPRDKCCLNQIFRQAMLEKPFSHEEFLDDYHSFVNSDICVPYVQNIDANIILYGHNHLQSYAYCGDKLIINPGACGLPFDFSNKAAYTILEETRNGFNVIERRVAYDIESLIHYTRASVLYEKNKIICELTFLDVLSGRNNQSLLFDIAREIATAKDEEGDFFNTPFSSSTWDEAGERFIEQYGVQFPSCG